MGGWRFADRGWFINDRLNLRSEANRRIVANELAFPNVAFGVHRWFAGGSSLDAIAITSLDQWDADLARGRPGDNVILLSLRQVEDAALVHAGDIGSPQPAVPSAADVVAIDAFNALGGYGEIFVVRRFSPRPGEIESASRYVDLRDAAWPWQQALAEHSVDGGEVWLFDGELLWRDHDRRRHGAEPPETWTASHGICLVDGYVPDENGRVVCGGPY
jgi:hypothetical protein